MTQIAGAIVLAAIILGGFIGLTQRFEVAANGGTVISAYVIDSFRGTVYICVPTVCRRVPFAPATVAQ